MEGASRVLFDGQPSAGTTRLVGRVPLAVGTGALLLLGRPLLDGVGGTEAFLLLAYAGLLAVSLRPGMPRESTRALPGALVAGVGIGSVLAAARAGGPAAPLVVSAWAIPVNLAAAVAEEAYFRRLVYGALGRWGPAVAVGGSAVAFALIHVPVYGPAAFWVDLGAGLFLGWQRWASGGWAAPTATHAAANLLAVLR